MSEPTFYTGPEILEILDRLVAQREPGYIYAVDYTLPSGTSGNGCHYVRDGEPSCLIGRLVIEMGATIEWLSGFEGTDARTILGHPNDWDNREYVFSDAFRVSRFSAMTLNQIQASQDNQDTWSYAVDRYRGELARS